MVCGPRRSARRIVARRAFHHIVTPDVATRTEELARVAYGRLLSILAARDNDIEFAEDCLSDAFAAALRTWPSAGLPDNPEAWLLTVARNRQRDVQRSSAHQREERYRDALHGAAQVVEQEYSADAIPDHRLALLFVCAHPAIDPAVRTPLMLQTVLGLDAERIASAFAIPPATMAQRLVRAKRRIRDTRIPFVIPERHEMAGRLPPVLEAIYGAYAIDFAVVGGIEPRESLVAESLYLARTLAALLPAEPEVLGLAALLSLSIARSEARAREDTFVSLAAQDTACWNAELIADGERYLHHAHGIGRVGRFQLEAAIQSGHCARAVSGVTDWHALCALYVELVAIAPTLGALVAHAAAVGHVEGARTGLSLLDRITNEAVLRFQPAWATRAHLLVAAGDVEAAATAYARAISLTTDPRARRYLETQRVLCADQTH